MISAPLLLAALVCLGPGDDIEATTLHDAWARTPDRPWPGAEYYACRVQDWRVRGGRVECLTGDARLGFRTLHLLTRRVERDAAAFTLSVRVDSVEAIESIDGENAAAGFLLGAGDDRTDPRLTALVQQAPASGGGILAVVEPTGRVRVLDFSSADGTGGTWSIGRSPGLDVLPAIVDAAPLATPSSPPFDLVVRYDAATRSLVATASKDGAVVSRATASLPRDRVAGAIALVSHGGPRGSRHGFAFRDLAVDGATAHDDRAFGPVLGVQYTLDRTHGRRHTLKLTAQLPVLGDADPRDVRLEVQGASGRFDPIARATIEDDAFIAAFRVDDWDASRAVPFRVVYDGLPRRGPTRAFEGVVRAAPRGDRPLVVASMSCVKNYTGGLEWSHDGLWFPHADLVERVARHDPDLLFFAGDQIYEGDVSPPDFASERATLLDYHTKWQRFLWSFRDLLCRAPAVTIPDDHDVFHGNLWGAGGVRAVAHDGMTAQDAGGYKLPAWIVNAIHRTQTSHLPDAVIRGPIGQGIVPYTTRLVYGDLDCAILSDRMWKDSATPLVPAAKVVNGFFQNAAFDPTDADVPGARLLGPEQEEFLAAWAGDRAAGARYKVVLSQSPFTCVHTLPFPARSDDVVPSLKVLAPGEYAPNDVPVVDTDSNGWPQSARDRALRSLKAANALHLAGDQHLATVIRYGIDAFRDGTIAFTGPAVANTWPRRWMPREPGANREEGAPPYTGDFLDGFGNRITVLAVANPRATGREPRALLDRSPGYGVVRFAPDGRTITLEAWPRWADPARPGEMFDGWPIVVRTAR